MPVGGLLVRGGPPAGEHPRVVSVRSKTSNAEFVRAKVRMGIPLMAEEAVLVGSDGEGVVADMTKAIGELDRHVLTVEEYLGRCERWREKWEVKDIRVSDWKPEYPEEISEEFRRFIISHFDRFCDLLAYEPLYVYMLQAQRWLDEEDPDLTGLDPLAVADYWYIEWCRCRENSLYGVSKYGKYKESSAAMSEKLFVANMAHTFQCFLFDSGHSIIMAKPRQIAWTTLFMILMALRMNTMPNYHIKFIACEAEKAEEIFQDKFVFSFGKFPDGLRAEAINDAERTFRTSFVSGKAKKGARKTDTSTLRVDSPTADAINGGAPDAVLIDEAPFIDNFREVYQEGRPTLFVTRNGKLRMTRQLIMGGTGGRSVTSDSQFEKEHRSVYEMWVSGNPDPLVPVFLDWTCRPGITAEFYLEEKARYAARAMSGEGGQDWSATFRQHYPSSIDDVYASEASSCFMGPEFILRCNERMAALPADLAAQPGRFVPLFDTTVKNPPDSWLPHPVKGVEFMPCDRFDPMASAWMWLPPEEGWGDRWWQGTDPILTDEGLSFHASVIWDAHLRTVPCVVNMRTNDAYDSYMQSKLMGMYYAGKGKRFAPELVENNAGKMFIKWMMGAEWRAGSSMIRNSMLPDHLQQRDGRGDLIGINTSGNRKPFVVDFGKGMLNVHGDNIYIQEVIRQLATYVSVTNPSGRVVHRMANRRQHKDDLVDALFYAFLARTCYSHVMPKAPDAPDNRSVRIRNVRMFDPRSKTTIVVPAPVKGRYSKPPLIKAA